MEEGPSADLSRPPDPSTTMPNPNIHPPLLESSSKSSSQVREEAIHTAMAERKLDGTRTNVHMEDSNQIQGKRIGDKESLSQDLHAGEKSQDFTVPSARNPPVTTARNGKFNDPSASRQVQGNQVKESSRADQQQAYHSNFPRISSNFDRQGPKSNNARLERPQPPYPSKNDQVAEPAPYTVVQTYADRLRHNQAKSVVTINLTAPEITTKQGLHAVLYMKEEVIKDLASACKYTLIGKFSYTMPKVELIKKNFILQTQLSGGVKIAHFNS
uniref:Uncharacterized protein n=1 Tax=Solanum tuberosum TaxID=4113 RepID=M1DF29_SOLTU